MNWGIKIGKPVVNVANAVTYWDNPIPLAIAFGTTYELPAIWTEFGRSIPNAKPIPNVFGGWQGAAFIAGSKQLDLLIETNDVAEYCLTIYIEEAATFSGTKHLVKTITACSPKIRIKHRAVDDLVFITLTNVNTTGRNITSGDAHLIARLTA